MRRFNLSKCDLIEVRIDNIKPYADNPREHSEAQIQSIVASMTRFGPITPLLVSKDMGLIAGHGRLLAMQQMSYKTVMVLVLPHLSEAEARAFRIADNAIALQATWSPKLLAQELEYVTSYDVGISPLEIGFETGEVDFLIQGQDEQKETHEDGSNLPVSETARNKPAISQIGNLWFIGPHRILCGDAGNHDHLAKLLGDRLAAVVLSDCPYNVSVQGHITKNSDHPEFVEGSGEWTRDEFEAKLMEWLANQAEFSKPGALCYQFIDWRSVDLLIKAGKKHVGDLLNICIWSKPQSGLGSLYRSQHEMICVFRKDGAKHKNNVMLGKYGRNRSNIWSYPAPNGFGPERENLKIHPTCKNQLMVTDAIMDSTDRGDIVLDAFLGSGTTLLAAQQSGRIGYGLELDPYYVDLAVQRLAGIMNVEATLEDGRSFEQVRQDQELDVEVQNVS